MLKAIIYWLDTHMTHPLAWPYVIIRSIQYKFQDILPKKLSTDALLDMNGIVCPVCEKTTEITEQGLCENCGNIIWD